MNHKFNQVHLDVLHVSVIHICGLRALDTYHTASLPQRNRADKGSTAS